MVIGSNNRYENLDGLKVIAAFGIVAMHVSSNMGHPLTSEIATNVIGSMTHFVKLFLILSGFGMCCGYYETSGVLKKISHFLHCWYALTHCLV